MLYDPKWEVQTKADPFKLPSLIAWLEKQDQSAAYDYHCNGGCLLALYFRAMGFKGASMGSYSWHHFDGEGLFIGRDIPKGFNDIAVVHPRTYRGALERARAAIGG